MSRELPAYPIESVDRALRLLILLGKAGTITVSVAADELAVARSTAHRLLAMLQYHDFVRQDPLTKSYAAGSQLLQVGLAAVDNLDVRGVARPHLEELRDALGETVHLITLDGTMALFLDSQESTRALRVGSRRGVTMPAYCTSGGKALLADISPDRLDDFLPPRLNRLTPRSLHRRDDLRRELEHIREVGYATNFGESEEDISAVAVAIPSSLGLGAAAISVSTPSARLPPERAPEVAEAIRMRALAIGAALSRSRGGPDAGNRRR
jgi:DNA-binding IclR family transcriptional regulator